jgi:hypothetical protein
MWITNLNWLSKSIADAGCGLERGFWAGMRRDWRMGPPNSTRTTALALAPGRSMAWAREPSPILGKRRWGRRALALPWPRAQVIDIDVSTTGIR